MSLDQPTLLLTTALVVAFSGLLLLISAGRAGEVSPQRTWSLAMLAGAVGLGLLAIQQPVWDGLSTAVLLGASALSWTAARLFAERSPRPVLIAAGPLLWLLTLPVQAGAPQWSGLSCGIGAAYTLATAWEIRRTRAERLPSRSPALLLLVAHAAIYLARAATGVLGLAAAGLHLTNALILESMLHTNGMAFLLLAMVKERFELRTTEQLRNLARADALTGLANRRHFDEQFDLEVRRATRNGAPLGLLMIDVDHFKAYNDALGHPAGDACLRQVAATIAAQITRPGDVVARYGGEEFAAVLANTDQASAAALAERVRAAVEAAALTRPSTGGVVTISVGAAALSKADPMTPVELLNAADRALYDAKSAGRNAARPAAA